MTKKKKYNVKGTLNQKKVAQLIVEESKSGKKISGTKMLEKVGYSKGICKNAGKIIKSKGVQQELKRLGFSVDVAKDELGKIMLKGDNQDKIAVAREIFKVHGTYAAEKQDISVNKELDQALDRLSKLLPK